MLDLYHFSLSPFCRKVRIALGEKKLSFELVSDKTCAPSDALLDMNPVGTLPVLVDAPDTQKDHPSIIIHSGAIVEYLEEVYPEYPLLRGSPADRAEARRLSAWFDEIFHAHVTKDLLNEKIEKRVSGAGAPDMDRVRWALDNIGGHMDYLSYLVTARRWMAGDHFSIADITAAAHLSVLDYLGDIAWIHFPDVKDWYARIKSRPSFRALLRDQIPGMPPPRQYKDLDF